jgi:hypothetical protein
MNLLSQSSWYEIRYHDDVGSCVETLVNIWFDI